MDKPCHNSRDWFFFKIFYFLGGWWLANKTYVFVIKAVAVTQTYKSGIAL